MNPTANFTKIDIVSRQLTLWLLFQFCIHGKFRRFHLHFSIINNTLFLNHWRSPCRDHYGVVPTNNFVPTEHLIAKNSLGLAFEKAFTTLPKGLEGMNHHIRVIRYPFGGLNCVVCCQVDAWYQDHETERQIITDNILAALALQMGEVPIRTSVEEKFKVMPPSAVAEIKILSRRALFGRYQHAVGKDLNKTSAEYYIPQLWFGRTPRLIQGIHINGVFDTIEIYDVKHKFGDWEARKQTALRKMASLLSELRGVAVQNGFKSYIATADKSAHPGELRIFADPGHDGPVPDDLINKFWHTESDGVAVKGGG